MRIDRIVRSRPIWLDEHRIKVKVKICGITNWTDARQAARSGRRFSGLQFLSAQPALYTPSARPRIVRRLPKGIRAVGVFVNEAEEKMLTIARAVGLDYLQLTVTNRRHRRAPQALFAGDQGRAREKIVFPRQLSRLQTRERAFARWLRSPSLAAPARLSMGLAARANVRRIFLAGGLHPEMSPRRFARPNPTQWTFAAAWKQSPEKRSQRA